MRYGKPYTDTVCEEPGCDKRCLEGNRVCDYHAGVIRDWARLATRSIELRPFRPMSREPLREEAGSWRQHRKDGTLKVYKMADR
jgi:hypothetical protein